MTAHDIIGKTITNIYQTLETEVGGLDRGDCFVELDHELVIGIPDSLESNVWVRELPFEAESVFKDVSDIPWYKVRKIFGIPCYRLSHYKENKVKYLKDQKIIDFLWYEEDDELSGQGYLLLQNGYAICQCSIAPHGLGLAGLNYYESLDQLESHRGKELF